jgi:tellurite methyltransferase
VSDAFAHRPTESELFTESLQDLATAARLGPVVDLACGRGRHAVAAAEHGLPVVAVDRNEGFLRELTEAARRQSLPLQGVRSDLETDLGIPFATGTCGAILVFRFLYRPLAPEIERVLAPGGLLLYETFTLAQRDLGTGPTNPAFLLKPGELPTLFPGLEVLHTSEGERGHPVVSEASARLAARKPQAP